MSGMQMALLAAVSGGVVNPLVISNIGDAEIGVNASASFDMAVDGTWATTGNTSSPTTGRWFSPGAPPTSDYWVRFDVVGDAPTSGTTGAWLQLNVSRSVGWSTGGPQTLTGTLNIRIATDSGGANVVSDTDVSYTITEDV
jgi:hypothetical protein